MTWSKGVLVLLHRHIWNAFRKKNRIGWLVVLGCNATLTAKVVSWRSVTHVFLGFRTPVLTQLFFPKPPTTFLTCFCRGERRKYAGKKSCLNRGSNSHDHQVMSPTRSPLSHPGGARKSEVASLKATR